MPSFEITHQKGDTILRNKYGVYSKNELDRQILEGRLTIRELGELYNLKGYQIVHVLRSLGLKTRNALSRTRVSNPSIDPSLHQMIIGTLMGDAYMTHPKKYGLGHGVDQVEYCYHVAERLHNFVASIGDKENYCVTERSFEFWTYRHEVFQPYFERFYSKGLKKKFFTENTAFDLKEEGLAYWYMDDGKWSSSGSHLCVGNISEQEGIILIELLRNNFNLSASIQCHDRKGGSYTIYIPSKNRAYFYDLISPYVIPSMRYKVDGRPFPRCGYDVDKVLKCHLQLCTRAGRFIRYFGNQSVVDRLSSLPFASGDKGSFLKKTINNIRSGRQISCTNFKESPTEGDLRILFDKGHTDSEIAKMVGYGRNRVARIRRDMGIPRKSSRACSKRGDLLRTLFSHPDMTIKKAMKESGMSFYKVREWLESNSSNKAHQKIIKEKHLIRDLNLLPFDPSECDLSEYVFSKEDMCKELKNFLREYEWLGTEGVSAKWCFTMRLRGYLAGLQVLNEPASYSKMLGKETPRWECLIQRGCTVSWAHEHLGSKMLMCCVDWMIKNTDKRVFIGYADSHAGEIGVIYQACNFSYLGNRFGVKQRLRHPVYKSGKEFCEHSLRRTSVFKKWCKDEGIEIQPGWIKPNGFKDIKVIPSEIKEAWYEWGNQIVRESDKINVPPKGKYVLIRGVDKRETRKLQSLFKEKVYPYPKRSK